jgi:hypothetical protein
VIVAPIARGVQNDFEFAACAFLETKSARALRACPEARDLL